MVNKILSIFVCIMMLGTASLAFAGGPVAGCAPPLPAVPIHIQPSLTGLLQLLRLTGEMHRSQDFAVEWSHCPSW